jgi:UDP-N-acetylglucosamine--N-acetylmuramyl-(pentapeptide) pyrophosphoryl-undecaprenol N-acetylglucosamine transferase
MKVVIVGGHLSPALAVIEKLKNEDVFYIGRKHTFEGDKAISLESQEVEKLNIPFFDLNTARLQRKFTKHTLPSLLKFPIGFIQSYKILSKIKPDVVLGFGGYLFLPVALSAAFLKIPVVIHEQTLEAGFTNKLVAKFAKKICVSWRSSEKYFSKEKVVLTGNPIRQEIISAKNIQNEKNKTPIIYLTGGSAGAHALNLLVEKTLDEFLEKCILIHQTGGSEVYKDFERLEKQKSERYECQKFLTAKEAAMVMNKADLVVGRSGINTVTELIYLQKPAFLIPLPVGQKNEQLKNAKFIKSLGLGEFVQQHLLTPDLFVSAIFSMLNNITNYRLKEEILIEDAAEKIVEVLKNVTEKKT